MSHHTVRRGLVALAIALPVALTGGSLATPASAAPERAAQPGAAKPSTPFALTTRGFGTRVKGGEVPVESDTTAFQRIGCTNKAGLVKRISEAEVDVPGLGVVTGVETVLRTTKRGDTVASTAVQRVASVTVVDTPLGSVSIEGLRAEARAFHDGDGFHATSATDVGSIVFTPPVGDPQELDLPVPDGPPVEVPGLVSIELGQQDTSRSAGGARAQATTLVIDVIPSGTEALVGLARARMNDGVCELLFRGSSAGLRAQAVDGLLTKKRTPNTLMPCQGTDGKVQTKDITGVDVTDQITIGALSSGQRTWREDGVTHAWERGRVAGLDLGDGQLVIEAVQAKANLVKRPGDRVRFNADGTTIGRITVDGEPQEFPDTGPLEVPGVALIQPMVTKRTKQTFTVVGLRVTLLEGAGGVIDLGTATIGGKRSGR